MVGSFHKTKGPRQNTAVGLLTSLPPACPSGLEVGFRWLIGLLLTVIR